MFNDKSILITGTNGKSTVTTMAGEIFSKLNKGKVAVGGNLGQPVLDLVSEEIDCYVLELSSFQLETTDSLNFHISCILNIYNI